MMKKLLLILFILSLWFVSCDNDENTPLVNTEQAELPLRLLNILTFYQKTIPIN